MGDWKANGLRCYCRCGWLLGTAISLVIGPNLWAQSSPGPPDNPKIHNQGGYEHQLDLIAGPHPSAQGPVQGPEQILLIDDWNEAKLFAEVHFYNAGSSLPMFSGPYALVGNIGSGSSMLNIGLYDEQLIYVAAPGSTDPKTQPLPLGHQIPFTRKFDRSFIIYAEADIQVTVNYYGEPTTMTFQAWGYADWSHLQDIDTGTYVVGDRWPEGSIET